MEWQVGQLTTMSLVNGTGKNVGLALEDGQGETAASPKEDDADAMQNTKQVEKARSMYGLVSAFRNKDPCVDALYNSEDALPVPISEYQLVIKSVSKDISRETLEKVSHTGLLLLTRRPQANRSYKSIVLKLLDSTTFLS